METLKELEALEKRVSDYADSASVYAGAAFRYYRKARAWGVGTITALILFAGFLVAYLGGRTL